MTLALVRISPPTILQIAQAAAMDVNVAGLWQVEAASDGWVSPDAAYRVTAVVPFVVPAGQMRTGAPIYSIDSNGNVSETYDTTPLPAAPPLSVSSLGFYNLFTVGEQLAIDTLAHTDMQTDLFMKRAGAAGTLQLNNPEVVNGLAYLVSKGVITQDRAAQVAAGTPPN